MIKDMLDRISYGAGILNKKKPFKGPHFLEFHLTNACNINCLGCFFHSSRTPERFEGQWKKESIEKKDFQRVVDQAAELGIRKILFSGNGEPFMHPDIMDFIEYVKKSGTQCMAVTNGTLINREKYDHLVEAGLDNIVVSIWDHDADRYEDLRPGLGEKLRGIKDWLEYRKKSKIKKPSVTLTYLINNRNFNKINDMLKFSEYYGADNTIFKIFKVYADATKDFMMTPEQMAAASINLKKIAGTGYGRSATNAKAFARFLDGSAPRDYKYYNDFLRDMPCYIGWFYMIILIEGDVIPCCGCRRYLLGNIYKKNLVDIWKSIDYQDFRKNSLLDKNTEIFDDCHCGDLCSHYQLNLRLNKVFGALYDR